MYFAFFNEECSQLDNIKKAKKNISIEREEARIREQN